MSLNTVYLSIDPGTTGALALLCGESAAVFDVPTFTETAKDGGKRTHVDLAALCALVKGLSVLEPVAVIEKVGGRKGDQAFTTGVLMFAAGAIATACVAAGIEIRYVEPREWKRRLGLKGGREHKDQSQELARKLYPALVPSLRRVKDHNRAEAVLIGHWAKLDALKARTCLT